MSSHHSPTSRRRYPRDSRARARRFHASRAGRNCSNTAARASARLLRLSSHRPRRKCARARAGRNSRNSSRQALDRLVRETREQNVLELPRLLSDSLRDPRVRVAMQIHPPRGNRIEDSSAIGGVKPRPFAADDLERRGIYADAREGMPDFQRVLRQTCRSPEFHGIAHARCACPASMNHSRSKRAAKTSSNAARFNCASLGISPRTRTRPYRSMAS